MASKVFFGSARQAKLEASETLPAKLDLILEKLAIRERVKGELVVLKMHTGNNIGYSTVHPVFVRKVVQAIKDGGGKVFITDVDWDVKGAAYRGYSSETLGCQVYPSAGLKDSFYVSHKRPFKNIQEWKVAGMIEDATFLLNLSHAKGHPSCSYGGAFKNIALGCMIGETRSAMHDTMHFDPYWFGDKCPDKSVVQKIIAACPFDGIVEDKHHPGEVHLHPEQCNNCGRCLEVAPPGSLKIDAVNFQAFQEACAISTAISMSTFAPEKSAHIVLATHMTPVCDCFGFTSMPIMRDVGIFGSNDIVAVDQAVLDATMDCPIYEENLPTSMAVVHRSGHPLSWIHGIHKDPYKVVEYGAREGLGSREYEIEDVLPVAENPLVKGTYIAAH
jgi:uncharacterized Fe-S center protein